METDFELIPSKGPTSKMAAQETPKASKATETVSGYVGTVLLARFVCIYVLRDCILISSN